MRRVPLAAAAVAAGLLGGAPAAAAPPVEVRVARGVAGIVPAGGIDVVEVEVVSRADAPLALEVTAGAVVRPLEVPARGRARLALGRRVPGGIEALPAIELRVGRGGDAIAAAVPAARVVARPVIVVADDPAAAIVAVEAWRRDGGRPGGFGDGLGDAVAVRPEAVPARWQALAGAAAIVIDRPLDALGGDAGRAARRHLGAGGLVCRLDAGEAALACTRPAPVAVPRSPVRASSAAAPRAVGAVALALALALAVAAALRRPRWRGAALVAACAAAAVAAAAVVARAPAVAARCVRVVAAAPGEDWVAAEVGVAATGAPPRLDGDLWIEPSGAPPGLGPLDDAGFGGRAPAGGSYRVRGFVPAGGGGWARGLARVERAVEAP